MEDLVGIVSIVKDNLRDFILEHWKIVEDRFDSKGVQSFVHPNISFQGGFSDDIDRIENAITELSLKIAPFEIIVDGFGFFEEPSKVVFLKVVKTEELTKVHKDIHDILQMNCRRVFDLYNPEYWVPHLTIAMEDITSDNFQKFKYELKDQCPKYRQVVSDIHLIKQVNPNSWRIARSWECKGI